MNLRNVKKYILPSILIIVLIYGFYAFLSRDTRHVTIDDRGDYIIEDRGDFDAFGKATGKHTRYIDNKKLSEVMYNNGEVDGVYTLWYKNGEIRETTEFSNGKREGELKEWSGKGLLIKHEIYKNDTLVQKIK